MDSFARLGAWAAEGVEAMRAKTEYRWEAPTSPGLAPWAQEVIPGGAGLSRVAADDLLPPTLLGANHSDTFWYREDLQRRMVDEDAFSCLEICGLEY